MAFCEKCGANVEDSEQFCPNCGNKLANNSQTKKFCSNCGGQVNEDAVVCPNCGVSVKSENKSDRKAIIAGILSAIIPGVGQFLLGFRKKGAIFLILAIISTVLTQVIVGRFIYIFVWVLAVYDAYNSGELLSVGREVEDELSLDIW